MTSAIHCRPIRSIGNCSLVNFIHITERNVPITIKNSPFPGAKAENLLIPFELSRKKFWSDIVKLVDLRINCPSCPRMKSCPSASNPHMIQIAATRSMVRNKKPLVTKIRLTPRINKGSTRFLKNDPGLKFMVMAPQKWPVIESDIHL